jgi:CheY-like chemotaxis protein
MASLNSCFQNILLADDDEDDCVLFKDALAESFRDIQIDCAKNGNQLMEMLSEDSQLPDIIFLDVNMPLKNGFECLKEIRDNRRLRQMPVIIFSTSVLPWAVDVAYELKADFYVKKPDTFSKLKEVLQKILSSDWKSNGQDSKNDFLINI